MFNTERKIIYNTKESELIDITDYRRNKKISKKKGKILMLLSDNELHSIEEINEFIYGKSNKNNIYWKNKIIVLMFRLKKRIKNFKEIKINNKRGIGYMMKGDIYII